MWSAKELERQYRTLQSWELAPFYFIGSVPLRLAQVKTRRQPGPNACGLQLLFRKDTSCVHFMVRRTKGMALHVGEGLIRT